ncbi:DNA primase [Pontibacillus halophilus JSM 076056 = DSM 19796]|uniref:DNA primase n=1 Tax=Pontibacillus halophilus JSM 076056 = DSM 19796 TaxID=1385510 RepID=A0A0A5GR21_9BACI|nr:DNA primase [Pontibacillus halophilus]KGX93595.1 DNA primase [Pontibacillus halophilus JSM 076056 = DSM 19796]
MSDRIPDHIIEEVRNSNDIVDVIGEYVQLKQKSRNYFGLCPFHGEKTPSFSVSPDKQIFHCFGCGKGGNVLTFIREIEGVSFREAVQLLATKSGHEIPNEAQQQQENTQQNQEANNLLNAHEWLTKLYHHLLRYTKEGKEGLHYLKERGFTEEIIDTFQLGFAPNSKDFTKKFLEKKGFHPQTMVKGGLLSVNDSSEYSDRFRGRVIFPIRNHQGKTVAFGGRTVGNGDPKYLNSPETELFHKGRLLYNFDLARPEIRKTGEAILFEGYVDVLAAYQVGVKNGVASLGTSLTETQAKLLRRYVDRVIISYDSDNAGIEAAKKAAKILKQVGCEVRVAQLNYGMDPDDYIKEYGGERFRQVVNDQSSTYMTFMMTYLKRGYNLANEGDRIQYIEQVLDEISTLDKPIERDHYVKELATEYDLSKEILDRELAQRLKKRGYKDNQEGNRHTNYEKNSYSRNKKLLPAFHNAERHLIYYMLQEARIAEQVQDEIGGAFNMSEHQVIVTYLYAFYEEGHAPNPVQFMEQLPEELQGLVSEIIMLNLSPDITSKEIQDYMLRIQAKRSEKEEISVLEAEQKEAERQNDPIKAAQIAMQIVQLKQSLKH